jgi:tetratricopeptide (TPR) repeat protein
LFVGAGITHNAIDESGLPPPTAVQLAIEVAERFNIALEGEPDLAKIAEVAILRTGRIELNEFVRGRLAHLEPDETLKWLFSLTWRAIFTTNYDRLIQRSYELIENPTQSPLTFAESADLTSYDPHFQVPVYHLHGSLFEGTRPFALLSETDYARFGERRRMLFEILKTNFATSSILYVGYSHNDANWRMVYEELREEFQPSAPPESFRVAPTTPALDREILESHGVHTLDGSVVDLDEAVHEALGDVRVDPRKLTVLREAIPSDLLSDFEENPAAVSRLLNSWAYVNGADFNAPPPNVHEFLRGDHATWSLIAQGKHFLRDVEAFLVDECVEYFTSPKPEVKVILLLGPAGYGVTTTLMSLAVELMSEFAGTVYFHRRGRSLVEGDMEYATSRDVLPRFFIVDNAADATAHLPTVIRRLQDLKRSACIILGERLNEWRQSHMRLDGIEFVIEPLSDGEIDRMLERLRASGALGALADLSPALQVSTIKSKHQKELLVAMREATEGRAFDAIIEDEYRNIGSDDGRRLYAAVSGFYRLRAYIRDQVLAAILDRDHADLYKDVREETEGVVEFECVDDAREIYAARARHHVIAQIVWERCLEPSDRENLMLESIRALNLTYAVDANAFDKIIQSDDAVDSIRSFEDRVRFFEDAVGKDPRSPYVRQHYARMLRRERRYDLALQQISNGLELGPDVRVLHHTKGMVLTSMALEAESDEVGRRRLVQAEQAFRHSIDLAPRDEYGYQSLAELYLGWAKRASQDQESADYIRKAEEVITEGLKRVRVREGLWVVSAQIAQWLGDHPAALAALEEAVQSTPGGTIGRYLLGKLYLERGDPTKSKEILQPVIEQSPEEVRACLLYTRAIYQLGASYGECIATLRLCSPHGLRYPRYIGTLGGMLFMNGEFTESEKLFEQAKRRGFAAKEAMTIHFMPLTEDRTATISLVGDVSLVRVGYAFVHVEGYPDFFCPGSKFGDVVMERGLRLSFTPAFTARGNQAVKLVRAT